MVRGLLFVSLLLAGDGFEHLAAKARATMKRDPRAAIPLFQRALEIRPHEPTALSELGWCAFLAGDDALAEAATVDAVQSAGADAQTKGASLYNLGRIRERRKETAAAIDAYQQSLAIRPNRTVRERLAALDPVAAEPFDPLFPEPMDGPYPSERQFCARDGGCESPPTGALREVKPPFEAARFVGAEVGAFRLAVRLRDGWYFGPAFGRGDAVSRFEQLDLCDARGEELVVAAGSELQIIGVGASGAPSIGRARAATGMTPEFRDGGVAFPASAGELAGWHRLAFH